MSDAGTWIGHARDHVASAQVVLAEVERGLATVEKVEAVTERTVASSGFSGGRGLRARITRAGRTRL